jgi:hypothetical protein
MSHTYFVVPNASNWGYILFSLLRWIFSWNLPHFGPNNYHCCRRVHFAPEYVFSLGQASSFQTSYLIMAISQRIQEFEENPISSAGNKPSKKMIWG